MRLLWYSYRSVNGNFGWYQCDYEDFLQMFHNKKFRENLTWIKVRLSNGNWFYDNVKNYWLRLE